MHTSLPYSFKNSKQVKLEALKSIFLIKQCFVLLFENKAETILGRHSTLEVRSLHLGGLFHAEEEIQMTATMPNFVGQLQGFVYNGHR